MSFTFQPHCCYRTQVLFSWILVSGQHPHVSICIPVENPSVCLTNFQDIHDIFSSNIQHGACVAWQSLVSNVPHPFRTSLENLCNNIRALACRLLNTIPDGLVTATATKAFLCNPAAPFPQLPHRCPDSPYLRAGWKKWRGSGVLEEGLREQ